jgi:hypothetical protein
MRIEDWSKAVCFAEAAKLFTNNGRPISVSTLHRWRQRGIRGRKLMAHRVGGRWFVVPADMQDFIAGVTDDLRRCEEQAGFRRLDAGSSVVDAANQALDALDW